MIIVIIFMRHEAADIKLTLTFKIKLISSQIGQLSFIINLRVFMGNVTRNNK